MFRIVHYFLDLSTRLKYRLGQIIKAGWNRLDNRFGGP